MASTAFLQKAFLAYFGRPVDASGLAAFGGNVSELAVQNAFYASAESQALYGTSFGVTQINAIYVMLFGRQAEPAGLNYWANEVARGALTPAGAAIGIMNGAQNADLVTVNNKLAASAAYSAAIDTSTEILAYVGDNAAATARAFLATVTTTVPTAAAIDANVLLMVAGSNANAGTTFVLTTGADTLVGTAFNDTFNAYIDATVNAPQTFTAADSINGGAGIDTLNVTVAGTAIALPAAAVSGIEVLNVRAVGVTLLTSDLSGYVGLTNFNSDRSTSTVNVTNAAPGVVVGALGGVANAGSIFVGYSAAATAATLNITNGYKSTNAIGITGTGVLATTINVTGADATTALEISTPATSKATTINAAANLTTILFTTAATSLTVTGTGTVDLSGINFGNALNNAITTIDASAQTAGGTIIKAGTSTTLKFTGGAGNDSVGLGAVLATGAALDGGAGTDTLVVAGNSAYITAGTGAFIKNFEVVSVTTATVDLDNLATNNTLTGLRVGGSATVSNINAATAANITVYANATPVLNVKGATTPGQLDVVSIDVNDGAAAVVTITLTAPTLAGVETLNLKATDNVTLTSLANALALTGMTVTGAGNVSITTTAIALNPNVVLDASAATGNFTLDATGSTANGYGIKGSAGTNVITGGAAPIVVDLTKSVAKADQVIITSATGSNASVLQTITGFTNAVTTGDKLDVINTGTITANVAAGTATGVAGLTAQITSGVITFGGTAAATATLQNKIDAAATLAGTTQYNEIAFEHNGNTYVYEQGDTTATYAAGVDLIVQLTGVTGVTALSTTASGATTIFVV